MHISTSISTAEWAAAASAAKEHGAVRRLSNMLQALQDGGGTHIMVSACVPHARFVQLCIAIKPYPPYYDKMNYRVFQRQSEGCFYDLKYPDEFNVMSSSKS